MKTMVVGDGNTPEEAALAFVKSMREVFPEQAGVYHMLLRAPLELLHEKSFETGTPLYRYSMRVQFVFGGTTDGGLNIK